MLSDNEFSKAIDLAIKADKRSVDKICKDYNSLYYKEIKNKELKPLNKDFVSRLRGKKFKIRSERVLKFCEYIGAEIAEQNSSLDSLRLQAKALEKHIFSHEEHAAEFNEIRQFLNRLFNN